MTDTTIDTDKLIARLEHHIEHYRKSLSMTVKFIALPGRVQDYHYAAEALRTLETERDELQAIFDLRWKADMRAIKRWQETTGKDLTWPDHADLCVWLMQQLDEAELTLKVVDAMIEHD